MKNLLLIIAEVIICYISICLLSKKHKQNGLYIYAIIATFTSCIMCLKRISIMGVNVPIGFGVTTSLLLGGNIIVQKKGPEELKKYLAIVLLTALFGSCFLNLSGIMESSEYNYYANEAYNNLFTYNLRIYIALIISLLLGIIISSKIYYLMKKIKNKIIASNIFSIIITEFIENIVFVIIGYIFDLSTIDLILCIIFRYIIKTLIGVIGTIPMYIMNKYNE